MKSTRSKRCKQTATGAVRLLSPDEIESLRAEMKVSGQWMREELARRRSTGAAPSAGDQSCVGKDLEPPGAQSRGK